MTDPETHSLFFYGTLMAPRVLHRVCQITSTNPRSPPLTPLSAILHAHRRHRVRHCDYPAIVPCSSSTVRGTLVRGLRKEDVARLDAFEGDEYMRRRITVETLENGDESERHGGETVEAETYIWIDERELLEDSEWDFAEFVREKLVRWAGPEGESEYAESDAVVVDPTNDPTKGRGVLTYNVARTLEQDEKAQGEILESAV